MSTDRHLLVIGAQRSGTTYLHSVLEAHPDVAMAQPARPEPKVFCSDEAAAKGLEWYRQTWFAHARPGQLLGDKSTSYIEVPQAPRRAADMLGEPHVVAVLRDPVQRAISNWRFSTDNGFETRPLETALRENLAQSREWDPTTSSVSPYAYLERGRYAEQLEAWTAQFPRTTQVLFLDELLVDDAVLDRLWDGLDLDRPDVSVRPEEAVNQSRTDPPELSDDLLGTLREYFEASDRALSALLGRALPWRS